MRTKYRIHIEDMIGNYEFRSKHDLYAFLSIVDLSEYPGWYAEVVKEQTE